MTEKEKVEAYDKALKKASAAYKDEDRHLKATLERIFPELKEEDNDERIKKNCIHFLELQKQHHAATFAIEECIDWLEKQGETSPILSNSLNNGKNEQKSADKIEPRFKVGDWVVFIKSKNVYKVEKIENYEYTLRNIHGGLLCVSFSNEKLIREWTIQDAEDGDVIHLGTVTAIFKKYIGREKCICYCSFCKDGGFEIPIENGEDNVYGCCNATPATKEQRDVLMKAINDAGYEWDAEKKELKKKKEK